MVSFFYQMAAGWHGRPGKDTTMAGYIYSGSRQGVAHSKGGSPVLFTLTFKREAIGEFDKKLASAKKGGAKLGEVEEFECLPFEQCEEERQVMKRCTGTDKDGNPVVFYLERFHVGGQLERRRAENGG
jgi:hypothetical protein